MTADIKEAYDPVFWRKNADDLEAIAVELENAGAVLQRFGMEHHAKSVEMRVWSLRESAKKDRSWADDLEKVANAAKGQV